MVRDRNSGICAAVLCGVLCVVYAVTSWMVAQNESATADEPSHAAIGWLMLWKQDFRVSPDVPPLWEEWVGLGMGRNGMHIDQSAADYRTIQLRSQMSKWSDEEMYHTPGNDGLMLVNRARAMALVGAVVLAALIGWWAWKLGGAVAAVTATFLYCLDPNFIGHGALAKNDIASALMFLVVSYALWQATIKATWGNLLAVIILLAIAVSVKVSGLMLGPVLILVLGIRAIAPAPWVVLGRKLEKRGARLCAMLAVTAAAMAMTYLVLWASYDFRYNAGPDGLQLDTAPYIKRLKMAQLRQKLKREPDAAEIAAWRAPVMTRVVIWGGRQRLLPQAWTVGFIHSQIENQGQRIGYSLGKMYTGGRWYYFPLAAITKAPLATIAAFLIALGVVVWNLPRRLITTESAVWAALAMGIPALMYATATMTAHINIGLRHAFPVYPFVFVAMGVALARLWRGGVGRIVLAVLAVGLCVETASAYPRYVAFFNVVAAPHKMYLLTDSNYDWGQDLPLLAAWQKKNPDENLYFACFGRCDPALYGIKYLNLPGGYPFGPPISTPKAPGVVAVSATNRQLYFDDQPESWKQLGLVKDTKPMKVLGTTIFLYRLNPGTTP